MPGYEPAGVRLSHVNLSRFIFEVTAVELQTATDQGVGIPAIAQASCDSSLGSAVKGLPLAIHPLTQVRKKSTAGSPRSGPLDSIVVDDWPQRGSGQRLSFPSAA